MSIRRLRAVVCAAIAAGILLTGCNKQQMDMNEFEEHLARQHNLAEVHIHNIARSAFEDDPSTIFSGSVFPGFNTALNYFGIPGKDVTNEFHKFSQITAFNDSYTGLYHREFNITLPNPLPHDGAKIGYMLYFQPQGDCGIYGNCNHTDGVPIRNVINWVVTKLGMALVSVKADPEDAWFEQTFYFKHFFQF